jgi:DNA-binding LacI/PurR family transcriptional regulator
MSLREAPILIMSEDAVTGHALVNAITEAGGDTVFAASSDEALRHMRHFRFAGALLTWQEGSDAVAQALELRRVPVLFFGAPPAEVGTTYPRATVIDDVAQVVPTLVALLA